MPEEPASDLASRLLRALARRLPEGSPLRRILVNSGWLLMARGASMPLGIAESLLVTQILGVELFGVFGIVVTFVTVVSRLTSFRMSEFVVKYLTDALAAGRKAEAAATVKAALLAEASTAVLAFCAAFLLAPTAATHFIQDPSATAMIRGYSFVLLGNCLLETTAGTLQVFNRFPIQARVNLLRKTSIVAGALTVFLLQGQLAAVLLVYLAGHSLASLYQVYGSLREIQDRIGAGWWRTPLRVLAGRFAEMRRFAITTNIGATLALIVKESDVLWIAYFRSPVEAGYYTFAKVLLRIPFAVGSPMSKALYPEIARTIALGSYRKSRHLIRQATQLAAAWVVPVCLTMAALTPWIIRRFYGEEFLPAKTVIFILLIGTAAGQLFFWTRPTLLALGRPDIPLRVTILNTFLKVGLALWLVPTWGHVALAWILTGLWVLGVSITVPVALRTLKTLPRESMALRS